VNASPLLSEVRRFLAGLGAPRGIVVAVSGGPDSVALLHALLAIRAEGQRLLIAHLNHMLRGAESDGDETFVRQLHAALVAGGAAHLDLRCERIDIAHLARSKGTNRESLARQERYAWLGRVAREAGLPWIATGHTADDQAETVLHRLFRGTGLQGLRGIAARRALADGVEIIRPMLTVRRADVLTFLEERGQSFRQDSSNLDRALTRNRIRHELLPLLAREHNPAIVRVLGQLAAQADELHTLVEQLAAQLLTAAELPRAGQRLIFDRNRLAGQPRHLIREVFRRAWTREGWPQGEMGFADWDRLAAVALGEIAAVDLPGGIAARSQARVVQVGAVC
jgi:tRNA(Ile)-lysidine synthase